MSAKPDLSERGTSSIAVLGAGTWGAVLAQLLQRNGHRVTAWDFYPSVVDSLDKTRMHSNLPGFRISEEIRFTPDLADAVRDAQVCVMVVPSTAVRATCEAIRSAGGPESIRTWILCSKGIEQDTLLPLHDVMADALGNSCAERIGVLSGPSHAEEVARGLPTTIVASASDPAVASEIQRLFIQPRFRVYTHDDVLGVELGGALKNVIAIAAGISDGMGFGDNSRAALITRGLAEIVRLGVAMGARRETFMGLSGVGDLVVTTSSPHSRNHRFGELLAEGKGCEEALKGVGMVVEGYSTTKSARALGKKMGVEMPITEAVYGVLYDGRTARNALEALLAREAKAETQ